MFAPPPTPPTEEARITFLLTRGHTQIRDLCKLFVRDTWKAAGTRHTHPTPLDPPPTGDKPSKSRSVRARIFSSLTGRRQRSVGGEAKLVLLRWLEDAERTP